MSTGQTAPKRRAHTIYVTDETWAALERKHLERRLATPDTTGSKIDFVEQVLQAGLTALTTPPPPKAPRAQPAARTKPAPASAPQPTAPEPPAAPSPPAPSSKAPSRKHRVSALDRLMQSSDPGRPAPITSAAGDSPTEGSG